MSTARFQSEARRGVIYDKLASLIFGNDRDAAKAEIILWLFSGAGYNPKRDSALYKRYEDVVKWVKQVKKILKMKKGEDQKLNLAVYLQRFEADLMINHIYPIAKEKGYVLFSKHDSFLVPASDAQAIQKLMIEVLRNKGVVMNVRYKVDALGSTQQAA
ncbi:hypothetical protein MUN84_08365 [Hymenobacter sp. 5516J-16]|uniref:hypothetical protein n=1 Tax=Hymenobacter sp. 5516J-16 TaxID=2932253 RepID=UPI001FD0E818|nr:hypothetical protein [Hymenobacter sp. 5516J-16]UOQ78551.1 hypothetical protein MUN84_08365 [Hymenobacter sp. 5516J-16]